MTKKPKQRILTQYAYPENFRFSLLEENIRLKKHVLSLKKRKKSFFMKSPKNQKKKKSLRFHRIKYALWSKSKIQAKLPFFFIEKYNISYLFFLRCYKLLSPHKVLDSSSFLQEIKKKTLNSDFLKSCEDLSTRNPSLTESSHKQTSTDTHPRLGSEEYPLNPSFSMQSLSEEAKVDTKRFVQRKKDFTENFIGHMPFQGDNASCVDKKHGRNLFIWSNIHSKNGERSNIANLADRKTFFLKQTQKNKKGNDLYPFLSFTTESSFLKKLRERKKVSLIYSTQIFKTYANAQKYSGKSMHNLFYLLERRLDFVLYKICFFKSIYAARQYINQRKIILNQKIVTIPHYLVKPGDVLHVPMNNWAFSEPLPVSSMESKTSSFMGNSFTGDISWAESLFFQKEVTKSDDVKSPFFLEKKKDPRFTKFTFWIQSLIDTSFPFFSLFGVKKKENTTSQRQELSTTLETQFKMKIVTAFLAKFFEKKPNSGNFQLNFGNLKEASLINNQAEKNDLTGLNTKYKETYPFFHIIPYLKKMFSQVSENHGVELKNPSVFLGLSTSQKEISLVNAYPNNLDSSKLNQSPFVKRSVPLKMKSTPSPSSSNWTFEPYQSSKKDSLITTQNAFLLDKEWTKVHEDLFRKNPLKFWLNFKKNQKNIKEYLNYLNVKKKVDSVKRGVFYQNSSRTKYDRGRSEYSLKKRLTENLVLSKPFKSLDVEVSYKTLTAIFLYSPDKIIYPFLINLEDLRKSLT